MSCEYCTDASVIYRAVCTGCVNRRLARLPARSLNNIIAAQRKELGDAPADALRADVALERARLSAGGVL